MAKFIDLDTGLPALLNKVKAWVNSKTENFITAEDAADIVAATADAVPTNGSTNVVQSGGVYDALADKADADDVYSKTDADLEFATKTELNNASIATVSGGVAQVINNCNGADATTYPNAVLHAQQGKELSDRINAIAGGGSYEDVTVDVTMTVGKYIALNQGVGSVCPMTLSDAYLGGTDCAVVNMTAGQTLAIKGVGGNSSRLWGILDKDTHEILSVADGNSAAPANPYEKTIVADSDCIVVVNAYNANADPAYSNTAHTPYSVKLTTRSYVVTGGMLGEMQEEIDDNTENIAAVTEDVNAIGLYVMGGDVTMTTGNYIAANQGVGEVCPMTMTQANTNDCAIVNLVAGQRLEIKGVGGNASRMWAVLDKDTHVIQSVAEAHIVQVQADIPAAPFSKTIVAETDCIVVVNVYNANANPAYGNSSNTQYSVKFLPLQISSQDDETNPDVFPMTKALPTSAANYDALWNKCVTDGLAVRTTLTTVSNKPVYLYHIAPYNKIATNPNNTAAFTITDNNYFAKKKVFILSGMHGNEKQTPLWVYEFMYRIMYNDDYAALRSAYDWYIVPMANPTGYDANTRNNYNDVNLNRDFYRKTQAETVALANLIDASDFDYLIDAHQLSGGSGNSTYSPLVCGAFIPCHDMTDDTLTDLCTRYSKGGAAADAALCKFYGKSFMQTNYVWPPYETTGDDLQSHEYAFQKGVVNSCSIEFTQYAYVYSGSNTVYNDGSMVYGNTVFHHLMMAFFDKL